MGVTLTHGNFSSLVVQGAEATTPMDGGLRRLNRRQFIALAEGSVEELIGFFAVGESLRLRIPLELLAGFSGDFADPAGDIDQVADGDRAVTDLGLKEAKALADEPPKPIKTGVSKEEAEKIKASIEEVGGVVEIK